MTKTVLCFGDSLTWGFNPIGPSRHAYEKRWPQVLAAALGHKVRVIEEGLNGRTTAYDDHTAFENRNGTQILPSLLASHQPLDLVIIMLGSNDLQPFIAGSAVAAKLGMKRLIKIVRDYDGFKGMAMPDVVIVSPPRIVETGDEFSRSRFKGAMEEADKLALYYSDLADELECGFFDASSVAKASHVDGVHLDAENTIAIGKGLAPLVRLTLGL